MLSWEYLDPPENDNLADAKEISGATGSVSGTTEDAVREINDLIVESQGSYYTATVWYKWIASENGVFRFVVTENKEYGSGHSRVVGSTTGFDNEKGKWNNANVQYNSLSFAAEAGKTYYLEVASDGRVNMVFDLSWEKIVPPANDDFANAELISGMSGSVDGSTIGASREGVDLIPDEYDSDYAATVWYKWTAPADGKYFFSLDRWDGTIGVTKGYDEDDGWEAYDLGMQLIKFNAVSNSNYWIEVGASGELEFSLAWGLVASNDDYEDAEELESAESGNVAGTLSGATIADNDCIWQYRDAERTVWYKWVAPFTGAACFTAIADNGRSDLLYLVATRGYDEDDEEWDDCGYDGGNTVSFNVQEGETYYVSIATWNYVVSGFTLSWQHILAPENDDFACAAAVSGISGNVTGTNIGAGVENGEPLAPDYYTTASVWWKWIAPKTGSFTFETLGSDFDTVIGVYTGNAVDSLSQIAANDDVFDGRTSIVTFDAEAETTYYICVGGYANGKGNVVMSWSAQQPEGEEIPDVSDDATPEDVSNAIESVGFADEKVMSAIGGSVDEYKAFKNWACGVEGGEAAVVESEHAAVSYMLGAEKLFANEPEISFGECDVASDTGEVTVSITIKDGEDAVAVASEKVKEMFEATNDLSDWDSTGKKLTPTVTDLTQGRANNLNFKVRPGDGTSPRAFLRIRK